MEIFKDGKCCKCERPIRTCKCYTTTVDHTVPYIAIKEPKEGFNVKTTPGHKPALTSISQHQVDLEQLMSMVTHGAGELAIINTLRDMIANL